MDQWHDFFLAQAGAAGVLTGLVFVAVSINLEKIVSDPGSGLAGRAAEALILLVAVLMASVLVLVPGQGAGVLGAELLVAGLAAWGWIVAIQLPEDDPRVDLALFDLPYGLVHLLEVPLLMHHPGPAHGVQLEDLLQVHPGSYNYVVTRSVMIRR